MPLNNNDFGSRLRYARRARNITQEQLAELVGISVDKMRRWERGMVPNAVDDIQTILRTLDITADYLFAVDDDPADIEI